jgi:hypothetical protein
MILRKDADALLNGIAESDFGHKPRYEGGILDMNHPAFIFGHLSIYPGIVLDLFGAEFQETVAMVKPPDSFLTLFSKGALCIDDPEMKIYPQPKLIIDSFQRGYDTLARVVADVPQAILAEKTPGERVARFPTKGSFLAHLMTGHLGIHLGQLSAWRRAMRLPPAA